MQTQPIIEKRYENLSSFYNDISPLSVKGNNFRRHIFRGQSSDKYQLIPSALRKENVNELYQDRIIDRRVINHEIEQIVQEYTLLKKFYCIANESGLKVPHVEWIQNQIGTIPISYELYRKIVPTYLKERQNSVWIPREMSYIAALAQHYGVKTRLLDWTFDIYVALYFAALGACRHPKECEFITIWALDRVYISDSSDSKLKYVIPPYSDNPNLNAQKGILTYWEIEIDEHDLLNIEKISKTVDRTPLDILCSKHIPVKNNIPILHKLMIPTSYAYIIFMQLNELGYNASRLFPGYQGVSRQIEEQRYLCAPWQQLMDYNCQNTTK